MPPRLSPFSFALLGLTLLGLATPALSHADDSGIVWNGFLNIVGGALKEEPVESFGDERQVPTYMAYDSHFSFDKQTSGGLQAQKRLDEKTSVTMQVFAQGDTEGYEANLKWLYLTYEPTLNSSFRLGRIGAPVYYYSDYLNVGYAYHWVSPPESVYPFDSSFTGINYVYQNTWGIFDWSGELMLGGSNDYFPIIGARVITRNTRGATLNVSTGDWLHFRAMALRTDGSFEVDALSPENLDTIIDMGVEAAFDAGDVPDDIRPLIKPAYVESTQAQLDNGALDLDDFPVTYGDLALVAETERWLLMTEIITVRTDAYLYNDVISKFVTGGVRMGDAMLHLTWTEGRANPNDDIYADRRNTTPASDSPDAVGSVVASQIRAQLASAFLRNGESVSLGVRFETSPNTALKFEITRFEERPSFDGDTFGVGKNTLFRTALNATF